MRVTKDMIDVQLRLPGTVLGRLVGRARSVEDLRKPDPVFSRLIGLMPIRGVRKGELRIGRDDGSQLRLVTATPTRPHPPGPSVLWIHGGGYASGSPEMEMPAVAGLVKAGCVVVSPEYRLSREAPFPAALEDCYAALLWLRDHAEQLGGRPDQIVVAGSSAGGGLTAAIALYARDRGEVAIAFHCPLFPMLDDRETESSRDNDAPVWDGITNQSAWRLYLGDLYGGDVPDYAAPGRAADLTGMPPAITYVGGVEAFRDETIDYVERLRDAGVPVEFLLVAGAWHGFPAAAWTKPAKNAQNWFRDRFADYVVRFTAPQPQPHTGSATE